MPGNAFPHGCLNDLAEIARPNGDVALELRCTPCGALSTIRMPIVAVHPRPATIHPDWDGFVLPFIVSCTRCGAEDQYEFDPALAIELRARAARAKSQGSVVQAELRSWDGAVPRRPAEMLEHLLEVARRDPSCGEGWRRFGNALEKLDRVDEAARAWSRAIEVDEHEFDAAVCLAELSHRTGADDVWERIACALERCSPHHWRSGRQAHADARRKLGSHYDTESIRQRRLLIELLLNVLEEHAGREPVGLVVAWAPPLGDSAESGKQITVTMSSIDLTTLTRWERLAEFLASDWVMAARLTAEPEERSGFLEAFLESGAPLATLEHLQRGALRSPAVASRESKPQVWRSSSKKRNRHGRTADAR